MKNRYPYFILLLILLSCSVSAQQTDSTGRPRQLKNVIRYNLSGAYMFGITHYVVFGYERLVNSKQSFSINAGFVSLPSGSDVSTEDYTLNKDEAKSGLNASVDYRFYLTSENKYAAPHGLYIGPYYSYNQFRNTVQWVGKTNGVSQDLNVNTDFTIHTLGVELGYQFLLWKRLAVDLVMIGPGLGIYNYNATFEGTVDDGTRKQILEGMKQLLVQRFPGMNIVTNGEEFNANGTMHINAYGYRYIIHVGYAF